MNVVLAGLAPVQLERLADELERGGSSVLEREEQSDATEEDSEELRAHLTMVGPGALAHLLRAVAAERRTATQSADQRLELVWTGPERDSTGTRETSVVVRELFQSAERDILVAGYALYNSRAIFEPLVERMLARPSLRVRLILNILRTGETQTDDQCIAEFARRLRAHHWPPGPLPAVFYDPRSVERRPERRAVMHAKCVLVDGERCFLTSANLTEAAQVRNVELGVVINDPPVCKAVMHQFDDLIARGDLRKLELAQLADR